MPTAYYLNSVTVAQNPHANNSPTTHLTFDVDYSATIKVPGGGKVTMKVTDTNCRQVQNCGDTSGNTLREPANDQPRWRAAGRASFRTTVEQRRLLWAMGVLRCHQRDGRAVKRRCLFAAALSLVSLVALTRHAQAEIRLVEAKDGGWEVYTSGRVGGFVEVLDGDGIPAPSVAGRSLAIDGAGIKVPASPDPNQPLPNAYGHALASRVRSGFLGNILSLGVRHELTDSTMVSGQISLWSTAETDSQRTYLKDVTDAREGYLKVQGPGGSLLVGRALSLFGRGATETDFLYGHGYAVGAPTGFTESGPSGGHIGFGILANVFVAGVAYATPSLAGLQLTVGYYDPAGLIGVIYSRTKLGRPEAAATYDADFGGGNKLHVFTEAAVQQLYDTNGTDNAKSVWGISGGARAELGPFHLGVAGFTGKGLGGNFFLNQTDSMFNKATNNLRTFDGAYVQTQLSVQRFDFNAGWGVTRAHQMTEDLDPQYPDQLIYLKSQMGLSGVVVYHFSSFLHGALDYFRADTRWWLGEKQIMNSFNAGMTLTW